MIIFVLLSRPHYLVLWCFGALVVWQVRHFDTIALWTKRGSIADPTQMRRLANRFLDISIAESRDE
jgi:hypothetical protein